MAATKIKKRQIENLQIGDIDVAAAANIAMSKIAGLTSALDGKETAFTKNSAFNKNFGTTAGTVSEGNHTHDASGIVSGILSDDRIPSLAIDKITGLQNALDGKEAAFSKNTAFNKNFGTASGTVAEGNHTHTFASITDKPTTLSGYGITDTYTKTEVDAITGPLSGLETGDQSNLVAAINELYSIVNTGIKTPLPIDCSGDPDYPAAEKGDSYRVTVAGKIGGASGRAVEVEDLIVALVDTPAGDQATVGSNWAIYQSNIDKATESVFGTGRIATAAEVTAGTNDQSWVTPLKLTSKLGGYVQSGALGDYYTKTNLQTAGQAQVHWGNVTNTPTTLGGYGLTRVVAANASDVTDSEVMLSGGANSINNTSAVYVPLSRDNTPSWATSDGGVLTVKGSNNAYRQLWIGRLGEVGIRGGTGSDQYTDDWIQLATHKYSDANYLNLSSEKDAYLPVVNSNYGVDANNIGGANAFYTNKNGNPNTPATGPLLSLQASSNYGGQLSIRAGDISGTTDEWYYRSTFSDGTGTWFRIASREWTNSQGFLKASDGYASIDPTIAKYTGTHPSISDLNTVNSTGIFRAANANGSPFTGILGIFQATQSENSYAFQLIGGISGGNDMLAYRVRDNLGSWGPAFRVASREYIADQNFLTSADLSNYVTTNTSQSIEGVKKFLDRIDIDGPPGGADRQIRFYNNSSSAWSIGMSTSDNFIINGWNTEGVAFNAINLTASGKAIFSGTVSGADAVAANEFVTLGQADTKYLAATSPAGSITEQNITDWNEAITDITALEQDISAINQDITTIEGELDGMISSANYVVREALTGAKDGVNKSFTLANAPAAGKEMIFLNGQLLSAGGDYTITGATVTLTAGQEAPVADDVILGTYIH